MAYYGLGSVMEGKGWQEVRGARSLDSLSAAKSKEQREHTESRAVHPQSLPQWHAS